MNTELGREEEGLQQEHFANTLLSPRAVGPVWDGCPGQRAGPRGSGGLWPRGNGVCPSLG